MEIGIIGYGGMGAYHEQILNLNPNFCVKKVYDVDSTRKVFAQKKGLISCESEDEILTDKNIDTVLIALPNDIHFKYAKKVINSKKNVLLEKPATIKSKDFETLIRLAQKNDVWLTVHQNRRFDNDFLAVKNLIASEEIGQVYKIESCVMAANGIPGEWRKYKLNGGGMILDWGVHLVDQMVTLYGKTVKSVYSNQSLILGQEVDDGFSAYFILKNGVEYNISVDTNCFIPCPRWRIYGTLGTAKIDNWGNPLQITKAKESREKVIGIKAGNGFTKTMAKRENSTESYEKALETIESDIFYKKLLISLENKFEQIPNNEVLYVLKILEKMLKNKQSYLNI